VFLLALSVQCIVDVLVIICIVPHVLRFCVFVVMWCYVALCLVVFIHRVNFFCYLKVIILFFYCYIQLFVVLFVGNMTIIIL
jgi:hypothetical protein